MFARNEKGNLVFNKLDFECIVADALEGAENESDLKWMTRCLIDIVQLTAWEIATCDKNIEDWEDLYWPM